MSKKVEQVEGSEQSEQVELGATEEKESTRRFPPPEEADSYMEEFKALFARLKQANIPFVGSITIPSAIPESSSDENIVGREVSDQQAVDAVKVEIQTHAEYNHCDVVYAAELLAESVNLFLKEACVCGNCNKGEGSDRYLC